MINGNGAGQTVSRKIWELLAGEELERILEESKLFREGFRLGRGVTVSSPETVENPPFSAKTKPTNSHEDGELR
jgi:hypothetical protein